MSHFNSDFFDAGKEEDKFPLIQNWTLEEAIALAKKVEAICPPFGYHVALTGGLLYKEGPRKDCDLVLYQTGSWTRGHDYSRLLDGLSGLGFNFNKPHEYKQRYVYKTTYQGKPVDVMFPEFSGTGY